MTDVANANLNTGNEGAANNDSGNAPAWIAQLPTDLKGNEAFTSFPTIGELGKAYLDTSGKVKEYEGKVAGMIPRLGENPTEAELVEYRKAIGIPDSVDDYKIERPEMPEGMPYDEALEASFKEFAHKNNITPEVANAVAKFYNEYGLGMHGKVEQAMKANAEKAVADLKTKWGGDEAYTKNSDMAFRTFQKVGEHLKMSEELNKWADATGFGNDPTLVQVFHGLYELLGSDKFIQSSGSGSNPVEWPKTQSGIPLLHK